MDNRIRFSPQLLLGGFIIVIGLLFFLDNLRLIYFWDVMRFWPVILIAFGAMKIVQARGLPGRVIGGFFIFFGLAMTLNRLGWIDMRFREWWPLILVIVGVGFILRALERQKLTGELDEKGNPIDHSSSIDVVAVLSGSNRKNASADFKGGEITSVMGGCVVDLRHAGIPEGQAAVIDVFTFWGGIDIRVPLEWSVALEGTPILGGMEDKSVQPQQTDKRLIVRGYSIMGGVEIRN
ncbi:MAG: hypothetical protein KDC45_04650 [Bacteroidetes bacterium]|nr:hypothetical protein [Bacteroidota bacterium]